MQDIFYGIGIDMDLSQLLLLNDGRSRVYIYRIGTQAAVAVVDSDPVQAYIVYGISNTGGKVLPCVGGESTSGIQDYRKVRINCILPVPDIHCGKLPALYVCEKGIVGTVNILSKDQAGLQIILSWLGEI